MSRQNRGFTLLEVLVALAIFATAAIATIRSVSQHINTLNFLEEKTFASMVADNQMTLVALSKEKPSKKKGTENLALYAAEGFCFSSTRFIVFAQT